MAENEKFHIGHILFAVFLILIVVIVVLVIVKPEGLEPDLGGQDDEGPDERDQNLYQDAFINNDPDKCVKIEDEATRKKCLNLFVRDTPAEPTGDQALYQEAFTTNNPQICDQIEDASTKERCYAIFEEDDSGTETIPALTGGGEAEQTQPDSSNDQALYQEAFINQDQSKCSQIQDQSIRDRCNSLFI